MAGQVNAEEKALGPASEVEGTIVDELECIELLGVVGNPLLVADRSTAMAERRSRDRDHLAICEAFDQGRHHLGVIRPDVQVDDRRPLAGPRPLDLVECPRQGAGPCSAQRSSTEVRRALIGRHATGD